MHVSVDLEDPDDSVEAAGSISGTIDGGTGGNVPSTIIDCTGEEPLLLHEPGKQRETDCKPRMQKAASIYARWSICC